jgi:predicted anti-sigma-YlaC factor YlaD
MNHVTEDQLVLHYYGEQLDSPVEEHLGACESCRAQYRGLQRVLNSLDAAPVPERPPEYGAAVWQKIESRVHGRRQFAWLGMREWLLAGAMAALIVAAFVAGRLTQRPAQPAPPAVAPAVASTGPVRERILLVAVGDHLERSQTILVELENSNSVDIAYERQAAADLLESNRLFRLTAASAGDTATTSVLEDLERVLLEISNSPSEMSRRQLQDLQKEIENRGILFKVKVFASQVQEREKKDQI